MTAATAHRSDTETQTLRIDGMHCAACVRRVERALVKIDGVAEASADFIAGRAIIQTDRPVEAPTLSAAISRVGYELVESPDAEIDDGSSAIRPSLIRAVPTLLLGWGIFFAMQANRWGELGWDTDLFFPILFAISTPMLAWSLWPMLRRAALAASRRTSDMDTLIVLGVTAAWSYSTVSALFPGALESADASRDVFFDTALIIVGFVSLGRALEARVKLRATAALANLLELTPQTARVMRDGLPQDIPASEVRVGDTLQVRPGEQIPVDGTINTGSSSIDESMLTGESMPVSKAPGEQVFAGTINIDGAFGYQATQVGAETALARITSAVERAQSSKAPVQRLADTIASVFVPTVTAIAVLTFIVWAVVGDDSNWTSAVLSAVAVLVVACPCALGLATPAAIAAGSGRAARLGVLYRDAEALETAGQIETVVWDKTGTLTTGRHKVSNINAFDRTPEELVRLAAAVEQHSEHPLGVAIVACAEDLGINPTTDADVVQNFRAIPGAGAVATVGTTEIAVGNAALMSDVGTTHSTEQVATDADTPVYVAADGELIGVLLLADTIKPGAHEAIELLKRHRVDSVLLSGDTEPVVRSVAETVGIATVHARTLPSEKAGVIADIQSTNRRVAMVGDGINDAPALAQANLGLAMRTGSDIALEAAQVGLMQPSPLRASEAILLARSTRKVIRQNLTFAFVYNVLLIPLAAGLAVPIFDAVGGVPGGLEWLFGERGQFEPIAAGLAMVASSLTVLTNALRLNRWRV